MKKATHIFSAAALAATLWFPALAQAMLINGDFETGDRTCAICTSAPSRRGLDRASRRPGTGDRRAVARSSGGARFLGTHFDGS